MPVAELIGGFVLLLVGGELLVRGAVDVARRAGVSRLVIGLTLVGFGTSTPELVASVQAVLWDSPGIAVGNVVGSNIANILLILGITAVIAPVVCDPRAFRRDGSVLVAASLLLAGLAFLGPVGRPVGAGLVALLALYTGLTYWKERVRPDPAAELYGKEADVVADSGRPPGPLWLAAAFAVAGIAGTILGARWMVSGSVELARVAGVSETVIGLTVVAVGTSLPELATALVAARRREGDVAFGNIIGSNIFNILGILGVTALVRPFAVPAEILSADLWIMLAVVAAAVAVVVTGWRISRAEGAALLLGYGGYVAFQAMRSM